MGHGRSGLTLLSLDAAQHMLAVYESDIVDCVTSAWRTWDTEIAEHIPNPDGGTIGATMNDLMRGTVPMFLGKRDGVRIIKDPRRILVNVKNTLLLTFKKLRKGRPQNYPTETALSFSNQLPLPTLPDLSRLTVGYELDAAAASIAAIKVGLYLGSRELWSYPLSGAAPVVVPLPLKPAASTRASRVTRKKDGQPNLKIVRLDDGEGEST